jgi:hypothetical protein
MAYIRTKNQKKQRMIRFFRKFLFWKKKHPTPKARIYIGGLPLKKYEITFNYGRKMFVFAHSFSESKDIAEALIRKKYPTMQFRVIKTKEITKGTTK